MTTSGCALLSLWLAGCAATVTETVRERAASSWGCAPASVQVTRVAPDEHEVIGCGMRALYRCTTRRHLRAEGARYDVCERLLEHPLPGSP